MKISDVFYYFGCLAIATTAFFVGVALFLIVKNLVTGDCS